MERFGGNFLSELNVSLQKPPHHNLTLSERHILDCSKLKEYADNNFKFDENGRHLSKWVENIVEKGEIA